MGDAEYEVEFLACFLTADFLALSNPKQVIYPARGK